MLLQIPGALRGVIIQALTSEKTGSSSMSCMGSELLYPDLGKVFLFLSSVFFALFYLPQ